MRHTITVEPHRKSTLLYETSQRSVVFEYAHAQPVDVLAGDIVQAFYAEDLPKLKQALTTFTAAGYDPNLVHAVNNDAFSYTPHPLLSIAINAKHPKINLIKTLVQGGCNPLEPFNFAQYVINNERGPNTHEAKIWASLMAHTPIERWLDTSCSSPLGSTAPNVSLLHIAIAKRNVRCATAIVERAGPALLNVQGPDLNTWIEERIVNFPSKNNQDLAATLKDLLETALIVQEQAVLNATMADVPTTLSPSQRPRL